MRKKAKSMWSLSIEAPNSQNRLILSKEQFQVKQLRNIGYLFGIGVPLE